LNINTNGDTVTGIFLDAMGVINENHSVLDGRLFGGDTQNMSIVSGGDIHAPTTVPEPATLLLVGTALAAGGAAVRRRRARSQALPV